MGSLSLWKQLLTVELKYLLLLLTVFVWPWFRSMLNLQNSLEEERVACVLIKVTRLEWSLWKTESSVLHQPCFTVPQLFPFWDKWYFRAFQVAWVMQRGGGQEEKNTASDCSNLVRVAEGSCWHSLWCCSSFHTRPPPKEADLFWMKQQGNILWRTQQGKMQKKIKTRQHATKGGEQSEESISLTLDFPGWWEGNTWKKKLQ